MNWWIIEDALRDRKGHWVEYLRTFRRGLENEGEDLRIFASRECESDVADVLGAEPILPRSIWARMGDSAPKWKRLLRIFTHGCATYFAVSKLINQQSKEPATNNEEPRTNNHLSAEALAKVEEPDLIFVPTVLVHHLVGWVLLLTLSLRKSKTRVLLFFPNTPTFLDDDGIPHWSSEPSANIFAFLIQRCANWVKQGKLILGAETEPMVRAMSQLTGVPFRYLPHPVEPLSLGSNAKENSEAVIRFGAYGAARYEKGSDLIQEAIRQYLEDQPDPRVRFSLQWISDFGRPGGGSSKLEPTLVSYPQCEIIHDYFPEGGYERQIAATDVMILPYRREYRLRVSRVVIEAMQAGMPTIVAKGTTLHQQAKEHGTLIECQQNSPQSIVDAIGYAVRNYDQLKMEAVRAAASSQSHFSVKTFRQLIS